MRRRLTEKKVKRATREAEAASAGDTLTKMKATRRWLVHRAKVPHYANGSTRSATDTSEDQAQLVSYDEACDARDAGGYDGIGFALGPDGDGGHWQGIDLDDIKTNGLASIANSLPGYVERSPSGNGAHAIGYGERFDTLGANGSGIEAYSYGRYFTVTERAIRHASLTDLAPIVRRDLAAQHSAMRAQHEQRVAAMVVPSETITDLRSALAHLRADDYDVFIANGQALKELADVGRGLWIEWAQSSTKWRPEDARRWDTFDGVRTGYAAVFAKAQAAGWVNPRSKAAQGPTTDAAMPPREALTLDLRELQPQEFCVDGFLPNKLTVIAAAPGVGKTTFCVPLAAYVAGLMPTPTGMAAAVAHICVKLRRKVVYVSEHWEQVQDILFGLSAHIDGFKTEDVADWFHVLPSRRVGPEEARALLLWAIREFTVEHSSGYNVLPLVVFDTTNANFSLDSENDNAEVGTFVAQMKEVVETAVVWLICHVAKDIAREDVHAWSPRGASAWEGDANATAFIFGDRRLHNQRFMMTKKRRFQPVYCEVESVGTVETRNTVQSAWHEVQTRSYVWCTLRPSTEAARVEAVETAKDNAAKARAQVMRLKITQELKVHPAGVVRTALVDAVGGTASVVREEIKALIEDGTLLCAPKEKGKGEIIRLASQPSAPERARHAEGARKAGRNERKKEARTAARKRRGK